MQGRVRMGRMPRRKEDCDMKQDITRGTCKVKAEMKVAWALRLYER